MGNHVPDDVRQFGLDIRNARTVAIEYRHGKCVFQGACNPWQADHAALVLEPAVVMATVEQSGGRAYLHTVPLADALRVQVEDGMSRAAIAWTRTPEGLWLRFYPKR